MDREDVGAPESEWRAARFEADRAHLQAVAYRMLGSLSEAEDAVQEAWFRFDRADTSGVDNLSGWLTTVVSRICLDHLRARRSRREDTVATDPSDGGSVGPLHATEIDPEQEAQLAESVGLALLVVLETLTPAERLAFVLHDLFALPFEEIAPVVGRSAAATRQLASRARRRVQGPPDPTPVDRARQREVVEAFMAAARGGDVHGLLAVLDPDVELRVDAVLLPPGLAAEARGAEVVASRAASYAHRGPSTRLMLVDGQVGAVVAPNGHLLLVQTFTIVDGRIVATVDLDASDAAGEPVIRTESFS
jgi:RNA polymerase sigma-70 factor (ECF subfamily)